jgi:hypothetical protein
MPLSFAIKYAIVKQKDFEMMAVYWLVAPLCKLLPSVFKVHINQYS